LSGEFVFTAQKQLEFYSYLIFGLEKYDGLEY